MPNRGYFRPPQHLVKQWPEVFEDLYMCTLPVEYLNNLEIQFNNGRVWHINIQEQLSLADSEEVAEKLIETFTEYHEEIKAVDFHINVKQLKTDIAKETKKIL